MDEVMREGPHNGVGGVGLGTQWPASATRKRGNHLARTLTLDLPGPQSFEKYTSVVSAIKSLSMS